MRLPPFLFGMAMLFSRFILHPGDLRGCGTTKVR